MIVTSQTGTARRRAIFPNPGWQLIPGMQVRIQATIGDPKPKLLVDERAIGSDLRGDYLFVVNDKNEVEYRPVKLGIHVDSMRVIESGIAATDRVIVNGLQRARPGLVVDPQTLASNATATAQVATKSEPIVPTNAPAASVSSTKTDEKVER
jgi:membrane fusion protein, multidrug efflux system